MSASQNGHKEIVEFLIDKGAEVDKANQDGWTALMSASQYGNKEVVEALINNGAEVDKAKQSGWTALMSASIYGHKEVVEVLINKGAEVDKANQDGWTALMLASQNDNKEVVEVLINNGAEVDKANQDGWTALMLASQNGNKEIVEALIDKGAEVDKANQDGWTALMIASKKGNKEIVEALIDKGAEVDKAKQSGWTALMSASIYGHKEVVKVLIDKGADVDKALRDVKTALTIELNDRNEEFIKILLNKSKKGLDDPKTREENLVNVLQKQLESETDLYIQRNLDKIKLNDQSVDRYFATQSTHLDPGQYAMVLDKIIKELILKLEEKDQTLKNIRSNPRLKEPFNKKLKESLLEKRIDYIIDNLNKSTQEKKTECYEAIIDHFTGLEMFEFYKDGIPQTLDSSSMFKDSQMISGVSEDDLSLKMAYESKFLEKITSEQKEEFYQVLKNKNSTIKAYFDMLDNKSRKREVDNDNFDQRPSSRPRQAEGEAASSSRKSMEM